MLKKENLKFLIGSIAVLFITLFVFPIFKLGQTSSFKLDFFLLPIIFLIVFIFHVDIFKVKLYQRYFLLMTLIAISSIISNYIGGSYYLESNEYRLPTKSLFVSYRLLVFIFFSYFVFRGYLIFTHILHFISLIFLFSLLFGVLQFFDLLTARNIALNYFLEKGGVQEYNFLRFNRIIGVAPSIITWGGLSVMIFHFFLHLENRLLFQISGLVLAVFNVLASGSRAAISSLIISFILILLIKQFVIEKKLKSFVKLFSLGVVLLLGSYLLLITYLPEQFEFLLKRFDNAEAALTTSGRGEQLQYFSALFNVDFFGKLFGVGDSVVVQYGHLEIDYAYVLYSTGIIGFVLHYLIIGLLLREAYKFRHNNSNVFLFVWGSTISYLIFSIGFFFFYELYMGLAFWWLNGISIGYLWISKLRKKQRQEF